MESPHRSVDNKEPVEKTAAQKALDKAISGLKLRGIGPAVMGGRVADIAVHPTVRSTWYVAVGSGGLWKTTNAGTTWTAVFEDQPAYSIGCVAIDPINPNTIWVGTGENVSGRHVAWGDGVYRSRDAGATWECVGLRQSEHIGKILIDPRNSNVVFVAAEGPLWSAGGERGVYKTMDGGVSWQAVLTVDENTGVTDLLFVPDNPDVLYAASYERRRHIWSFLAGGAGSGIHKSSDGGHSWRRLQTGLPEGDMGRIGLAVTPADPNLVYATIEAKAAEKGFYRSVDKGESWEKRSDYISNGTGPHYYQQIEASPHYPDRVYQMDVFVHITENGGKKFRNMETGKDKHSDNHALWIDPDNSDHLLLGTDAGLYESFDNGGSWRHFPNMPVSQFYHVAVDNAEPFYNVMGGAQDLGTLLGPSRTSHVDGIRNQDWYVPMGADGYHVAFDPTDPQTMYLEWQEGNLYRYDRRSEEASDIKPLPAPGEPPERWNWDAPFLISPHDADQLYFGSQRLWRTDNQGHSWTAVSGDLTRNLNRYDLALQGRVWSVDALYDNGAMSQYSTISHISESPVVQGLLYVGTDDGLIQVSEDGGQNWRLATSLPGVPEMSFVNDVEASPLSADSVFVVVDAHKTGDYAPYIFESIDRGHSWQPLRGDLPDGTIVWALEQDHVNPDLIFLATEFGIYFTTNHGVNWHKMAGAPTIAFRDITLQRRDNDIVGATFGRGFYILDDYSPLRAFTLDALKAEATLYPVRDTWWYVPYEPMQAAGQPTLGTTAFKADNPPFGATFTYHLAQDVQTAKERRRAAEKEKREAGEDSTFPGWETLRAEALESKPQLFLIVRDDAGQPVRRLAGPSEAGLHRVSWDLRRAAPNPVRLKQPEFVFPWDADPLGPLLPPGTYHVELMLVSSEGHNALSAPQSFTVRAVPTAPEQTDFAVVTAFQQETDELMRRVEGAGKEIERSQDRLDHMRVALGATPAASPALFVRIDSLRTILAELKRQLWEDEVRRTLNEPSAPCVRDRLRRLLWAHWSTRQMPTATQQESLAIAVSEFADLGQTLARLIESDLAQLEAELAAAGAPWTPGRRLT